MKLNYFKRINFVLLNKWKKNTDLFPKLILGKKAEVEKTNLYFFQTVLIFH